MLHWLLVVVLALSGHSAVAFVTAPPVCNFRRDASSSSCALELSSHSAAAADITTPSAPPHQVQIKSNAADVGATIRQMVHQAAQQAVTERGAFCMAIPGGSILKMLVKDDDDDDSYLSWMGQTTLAYVNHKCVSMDDEALATHAKARRLFLNDWLQGGCNVIVLQGTSDGPAEAAAYQAQLQALDDNILPRHVDTGLPVFDLALIGVGDDGHVGSLYPSRPEVLETQDWVLPVDMKDPPSITLSLPVMQAAKQVVVAACGVSDKYPQGKSAGMYRAIEALDESLTTFPAVGLRTVATWVLDEAAASKLGDSYRA